jgi:hypothetical protein
MPPSEEVAERIDPQEAPSRAEEILEKPWSAECIQGDSSFDACILSLVEQMCSFSTIALFCFSQAASNKRERGIIGDNNEDCADMAQSRSPKLLLRGWDGLVSEVSYGVSDDGSSFLHRSIYIRYKTIFSLHK